MSKFKAGDKVRCIDSVPMSQIDREVAELLKDSLHGE